MAHELDKYPLSKDSYNVSKEKDDSGKLVVTYTCLFSGDKFSYKEGDSQKATDLKKFTDSCNSAKSRGESSVEEKDINGYKQAPDDKWILTSSNVRYGISKAPNSKIVKDPSSAEYRKETVIDGKVVYLRQSNGTFNPYIKMNASGEYKYFPLKDSSGKIQLEPYYAWVLSNPTKASDKVAVAKTKVDKDTLASIESGDYSYGFAGGRYGVSNVVNNIEAHSSGKNIDYGVTMGNPYKRGRHLGVSKKPNRGRYATFSGSAKSVSNGDRYAQFCGLDVMNANLMDDDILYPATGGDGYSSADGGFWDKVTTWVKGGKARREKRRERRRLSKEESKKLAKKVSDPDQIEYSTGEVEALYDNSGSNKPFKEWAKSENAKNFLTNLASAGYMLLVTKSTTQDSTDDGSSKREDDGGGDDDTPDNTILGMHPVTFGIVAAGVGLAVIITTVIILKKRK